MGGQMSVLLPEVTDLFTYLSSKNSSTKDRIRIPWCRQILLLKWPEFHINGNKWFAFGPLTSEVSLLTHLHGSWNYKKKYQFLKTWVCLFCWFKAIGRPHLPPYWSLGYQLSRWGYTNIDAVKQTITRMEEYGIPQVTVYFATDVWSCVLKASWIIKMV